MGITLKPDNAGWITVSGNIGEVDLVRASLSYETEIYIDSPTGKKRKVKKGTLLNRKKQFPEGLLHRVVSLLKSQGVAYETTSTTPEVALKASKYNFPLTLREQQDKAVAVASERMRGIIKAPPRTGKTVIAGALISKFPKENVLFLVDTKSLAQQTISEFTEKFGFKVNKIGDGVKKLGKHKITVALKRTLSNMVKEGMIDSDYFPIIIIDECHHVGAGEGSQYWKILNHFRPIIKIGLTATPPTDKYANLCMEGLIGPIIHEIPPNKESQAKPKLRIIKAPTNKRLERLSYQDTIQEGIVFNRGLNRLIVNTTEEEAKRGKSVLIIVSQVLHGFYQEELFQTISFLSVPFLCGGIDAESSRMLKKLSSMRDKTTEEKEYEKNLKELRSSVKQRSEEREEYRQKFINKELPAVIATVQLWGEGIDIPSLDTIILGHVGKSQIRVVQTGCRPLTKTADKEQGTIIDIFDNSNRYLVSHFGERICMYSELGWLGG